MEKELNCSRYGLMEISSGQVSNCYFHPNWDTSIDQNDPFEPALSSLVSSPTTLTARAGSNGGGDGMMTRELIGRLGSICDSGEISPQSCIATGNCSTNTSCYTTPLNSPPSKFSLSSLMMMGNNDYNNNVDNFTNYPTNLGSFNTDPGFVKRAAKFSCFGNNGRNFSKFEGLNCGNNNDNRSNLKLESGKLSRVNSEKKLGENGEIGDSREGSSVSEQNPGVEMGIKAQIDANSRKRKSISKAKVRETPCSSPTKDEKVEEKNEEPNVKRSKLDEEESKKENAGESNSNKDKQNNNNNDNNKEASKPEPPKDYIHVRARRGQATDSHSLAERVRREKISERMKFLQDLVPGCNKVTGKATVLDEIINYVQSLQRQVEFLSMKLATVNPRMEFNMDALLSKEMFQKMYPLDQSSAQGVPFEYQTTHQVTLPLSNGIDDHFSVNPLNAPAIHPTPTIPSPSIHGFGDSITQLPTFWEGDLQSIVQMGIAQNQTQNLPGTIPNAQMKVEL